MFLFSKENGVSPDVEYITQLKQKFLYLSYFQSSCNDNSEPIFKVFKWLMIECLF